MKTRHWCGTIGLEPLQIDPSRIDVIIEYLNDIGIDLMSQSPIPLGYDYACSK
jgi:pantoate kinase